MDFLDTLSKKKKEKKVLTQPTSLQGHQGRLRHALGGKSQAEYHGREKNRSLFPRQTQNTFCKTAFKILSGTKDCIKTEFIFLRRITSSESTYEFYVHVISLVLKSFSVHACGFSL